MLSEKELLRKARTLLLSDLCEGEGDLFITAQILGESAAIVLAAMIYSFPEEQQEKMITIYFETLKERYKSHVKDIKAPNRRIDNDDR